MIGYHNVINKRKPSIHTYILIIPVALACFPFTIQICLFFNSKYHRIGVCMYIVASVYLFLYWFGMNKEEGNPKLSLPITMYNVTS